jgi:hypothetical protein
MADVTELAFDLCMASHGGSNARNAHAEECSIGDKERKPQEALTTLG